jgi:hypothetical protein
VTKRNDRLAIISSNKQAAPARHKGRSISNARTETLLVPGADDASVPRPFHLLAHTRDAYGRTINAITEASVLSHRLLDGGAMASCGHPLVLH